MTSVCACGCVSERENLSPRVSQDDFDTSHRQQQSSRHGDDDGDDGNGDDNGNGNGDGDGSGNGDEGSVDDRDLQNTTDMRHHHHHHHHGHHGDVSAAESHDVAVQVDDDVTSSSQAS